MDFTTEEYIDDILQTAFAYIILTGQTPDLKEIGLKMKQDLKNMSLSELTNIYTVVRNCKTLSESDRS